MLPCPACDRSLDRVSAESLDYWACAGCGGKAVTLGRLRATFPGPFVAQALAATSGGGWRGRRRCPLCTMHMVGRRVEHGGATFALDHCDRCRLLWFDRGEHEAAEGKAPSPPPPNPDVDSPRYPRSYSDGAPEESVTSTDTFLTGHWSDLPLLLGLPTPEGDSLWRRPWTTWLLSGAIAVVSLLAFLGGEEVVRYWALDPSDPFRRGGMEFLTSFFLHFGFWHLASNLYFLVLFGACAEDVLRPGKYLLLVALSALAGKLLYIAAASGTGEVSAGASGGISGILAYWAFAFPHARVRLLTMVWWQPRTFTFSARTALGAWIVLQVYGALLQVSGYGSVNHLAHLGGAGVGVIFWLLGPDGPWALAGRGATMASLRRS